MEANEKHLEANQTLAHDAGTLNAWLQAYVAGDEALQHVLERRFTPGFEEAFQAWIELDPIQNPDAPAGPGLMPEYENSLLEEADHLAEEASHAFEEGVRTRETGEHYVRLTVILAAVLFLVAIGQRLTIRRVRHTLMWVAGGFIVYCIVLFATYPHLFG